MNRNLLNNIKISLFFLAQGVLLLLAVELSSFYAIANSVPTPPCQDIDDYSFDKSATPKACSLPPISPITRQCKTNSFKTLANRITGIFKPALAKPAPEPPKLDQPFQELSAIQYPSGLLIKEPGVDLSQCPTPRTPPYGPKSEVTIGDLHGNALKLIYFLVREGVLSLGDGDEGCRNYQNIRRAYQGSRVIGGIASDKNFNSLNLFVTVFSKAKALPHSPTLRFIGDELGDRGANDLLTLMVFDKLHNSKKKFTILVSNHGLDFLKFWNHLEHGKSIKEFEPSIDPSQTTSLGSLQQMMMHPKGKGLEKNLLPLIRRSYQPHLKLIDLSQGENQHYTFFTHAPINNEFFTHADELFNGDPNHPCHRAKESMKDARNCFDALNTKLQQDLLSIPQYVEATRKRKYDGAQYPSDPKTLIYNYVTWTRIDELDPKQGSIQVKGAAINTVHGHDGAELPGNSPKTNTSKLVENTRITLDNILGKENEFGASYPRAPYTLVVNGSLEPTPPTARPPDSKLKTPRRRLLNPSPPQSPSDTP